MTNENYSDIEAPFEHEEIGLEEVYLPEDSEKKRTSGVDADYDPTPDYNF